MRFIRIVVVTTLIAVVAACGSDSDGIDEIRLNAELDQGTVWSENIDLGSFPSLVQRPEHGQIQLTSSQIRYTPEPSFRGSDSAVVEGSRAVYRIAFTVHAVNQPPRLVDTVIEVIADRQIAGRLIAYDQDDDVVSYSLVSAPERGDFTLASNGEFSFIQDELRLPNASFVVDLSDGVNDPVRETVELLPAYGTNEEKAAYYYHSRHSHLLQAELRLANLNSDADTELSYIAIAEGYVDASMDDEVERIITNHIHSQQNKALAYRTLSERYRVRGETDKAREARLKSLEYQTQLIVDNGIENITNANGQFLWTLFKWAREAGDAETSEQVIRQMRTFVEVLGGNDRAYVNAYGFMATAYRNAVLEALEVYANSGFEEDRRTAVELNHEYAHLANNAGYQVNNSTGLPRYQLATLYTAWAAEHYFYLDEPEYAKQQVAQTISFYRDADYDDNYLINARPYAETTAQDYIIPMRYVAPLFSLLYPDQPLVPIQVIEVAHGSSYREIQTSLDAVESAQFLRRVLDGEPIGQVMDDLMAYYDSSPWEQLRRLTEAGTAVPHLGSQLQLMGYFDLADQAIERAMSLVLSAQYAEQNRNNFSRMTGDNGCQKLVHRTWSLGNRSTAQSRARQCETLLGLYTDTDLQPLKNMVELYLNVDLPELASNLIERVNYAVSRLVLDDQQEEKATVATYLSRVNMPGEAVQQAAVTLSDLESTIFIDIAAVNKQITILNRLNSPALNFAYRNILHPVAIELRGHSYNEADYQTWMLELTGKISELNEVLVNHVLTLSDAEQASVSVNLINQLGYARQYDLAETTIARMTVGETERIQLLARLSEVQAIQDDFPLSPIATVDTDVDGRANFFAIAATTEQLAETDIELDDDADGDGVPDDEDPLPLG